MRIVLMATGEIAHPSFFALKESGSLIALVTQPDRPVGRKHLLTPPRVKELALEAGIDVFQPERVSSADALDYLQSLEPDIIVVIAYGQLLSQAVIDVPRVACINVHASLLPRHRGASCIQAPIVAGDDETGVSIMHVIKRLDAGDVILQLRRPLTGTETADVLHDDLALLAPAPLMKVIDELMRGVSPRSPQDESLMTYAPKLWRLHGEIDWSEPALQIARKIQGYHSWPGTSTIYLSAQSGKDKKLKIFPPVDVFAHFEKPKGAVPGEVLESGIDGMMISCGGSRGGVIRIATIQPAGGRKMNAESFFAGHKIMPGTILGMPSPERFGNLN